MQIYHKKLTASVALCALIICGACKQETKDEKFKKDFEQFTLKECPKEIDLFIQLDSANYDIKSRTLNYHYTLEEELDHDTIYDEKTKDLFHENILKSLKTSIQLKPYKDEGITFRYIYRSNTTGQTLLELTFTAEQYNN